MKELVPLEKIEQKIFFIRNQKVMLDKDLAELFGVPTKQLNRQVKRNIERFPREFMFQLTRQERDELVPNWHQFKTMKHSSTMPYAFTEHGVAMLATVLNSANAIKMSIIIIKTFVKLREIISTHKELTQKLEALERKVDKHDVEIQAIFEAIKQLAMPPEPPKRSIGFHT
ncbi:MAG: ORF6N domain-containing protein [Candidatus Omnitrophica bacterium]|jgi:phage regulator Rha-like protein|nr:ORF6N domain-containing protein [Candidatus Omnitrophota bacterium]